MKKKEIDFNYKINLLVDRKNFIFLIFYQHSVILILKNKKITSIFSLVKLADTCIKGSGLALLISKPFETSFDLNTGCFGDVAVSFNCSISFCMLFLVFCVAKLFGLFVLLLVFWRRLFISILRR